MDASPMLNSFLKIEWLILIRTAASGCFWDLSAHRHFKGAQSILKYHKVAKVIKSDQQLHNVIPALPIADFRYFIYLM